ncbi:hypothetical protein EV182_005486 [Spiromyces aspiralis]|uniref:Uncharacterized protein n=1 Tax=Spiromyces aspiralis TaxID=68401 RepID=A0ACC1HAI9_9FUNG|nr:hypothetical protein EV182_005486 [Spiromyces aspiralis]
MEFPVCVYPASQELGHDLFQDHHTCPIRFVSYDILNNNVLSTGHGHIATSVDKELKGRFSFVCINSLHTYSRRDQERMVSKLALIVAPGGYVFGQTVGIARSDLDSNYEEEGGEDGTRHSMHTVDSFKILLTSSGFEDGDVVVNVSDDDNRTHLLHLPGTDHATVPEYATVLNFSAKAK